jgi:hydroxypyruvate isomerase
MFAWIGEVQVADHPGHFEPGMGELNDAGVAKTLKKMEYRGPVRLESFAVNEPDKALDAFRNTFTV